MRLRSMPFILAVTASLGAVRATAQGASRSLPVRDTTLANGLQIYVIENHTVPLATAEIVVHNGAMIQDSGTAGPDGRLLTGS